MNLGFRVPAGGFQAHGAAAGISLWVEHDQKQSFCNVFLFIGKFGNSDFWINRDGFCGFIRFKVGQPELVIVDVRIEGESHLLRYRLATGITESRGDLTDRRLIFYPVQCAEQKRSGQSGDQSNQKEDQYEFNQGEAV